MEKRPYVKIMNPVEWGVFLQSTGALLDTAKTLYDAKEKAKQWSKKAGDVYVDEFMLD